ncbi:MAG: hypothetical protein HYV27_16850 [Candidatus Hydrogenedentes bacterium]|nr:hypothetical protein [Candidatus Hydrogenedentota bacterium]
MEIKIGRYATACVKCERLFVHDEPFQSVARVGEESLTRQDYCMDCWEAALGADAYSLWRTKFYDPQVADAQPPEVFSPLRQLFYEAVESTDRLELSKAFLAAQLLRRQKVFRLLKESDESEGEVRVVLYTDRIGNRMIEVRDPHFSYQELEEGRTRLICRLQALENGSLEEGAEAAPQDESALDQTAAEDSPEVLTTEEEQESHAEVEAT